MKTQTQKNGSKTSPVTEALAKTLADTYTLYVKTQNYHWNVTGPHFAALHAFFQTQYEELAAAVDEIAERIRALGAKAPGSFAEFSALTNVKEAAGETSAQDTVSALLDSHKTANQTAAQTLKIAEEAGDETTVDLMIERMDAHQKAAWMLSSSLEK
jgi:starvation-inducible DNA-binding protein